jgi:hypothetical protein
MLLLLLFCSCTYVHKFSKALAVISLFPHSIDFCSCILILQSFFLTSTMPCCIVRPYDPVTMTMLFLLCIVSLLNFFILLVIPYTFIISISFQDNFLPYILFNYNTTIACPWIICVCKLYETFFNLWIY